MVTKTVEGSLSEGFVSSLYYILSVCTPFLSLPALIAKAQQIQALRMLLDQGAYVALMAADAAYK
jgi:hypothetical protein